eukprot:TRINITY_DN1464_c0_g1_i1.p1 TRINITY_DN1464_c0_g1~~TRINITY_DN1464_c0_g1_i1.p1  ORF type:complete len:165 (-),score=30.86 TRINITY_DN1464_c0_g1_i1:54-548(-)
MPREIVGSLIGTGLRVGIVVSRFNELVTRPLLAGAIESLQRHGVDDVNITVVWVPGAFEIPVVAKALAKSGSVDGVVCLGCVIRGATAHFDYVAGGAQSGIQSASLESLIPIAFGVLTTDTMEQALDRAGGKAGNKGAEAAVTLIETASVLKTIRGPNHPIKQD